MLKTVQSYDYLINRINITTRNLKAHRKILNKEEHEFLYPFYEKAMYISIALADLMVGLKYLDVSNAVDNKFEANHFARGVSVTCYELLNHKEKIIGETIYKTVAKSVGIIELTPIVEAKKILKLITKEHFQTLKHIRNDLYGHRHENGYEMSLAMLSIDNFEVYKIGKSIFDSYFKLLQEYAQLMTKL